MGNPEGIRKDRTEINMENIVLLGARDANAEILDDHEQDAR